MDSPIYYLGCLLVSLPVLQFYVSFHLCDGKKFFSRVTESEVGKPAVFLGCCTDIYVHW